MTKFTDGPFAGKTLLLHRQPLFLRVVCAADGAGDCKVDALDQVDDVPEPDEMIFAYRKVSDDGSCHINSRNSRGRRNGGFYPMATYALYATQPAEDVLRDTARWQAWCQLEYIREAKP